MAGNCKLTEQADAMVVHGAGLRGVLNLTWVAPPCIFTDVLERALLPVVRLPPITPDDLRTQTCSGPLMPAGRLDICQSSMHVTHAGRAMHAVNSDCPNWSGNV